MLLGSYCFLAGQASPDASTWHLYSPPQSGIRFAMPGTVHVSEVKDPAGDVKVVHRFTSEFGGMTYIVSYGDMNSKAASTFTRLWDGDRRSDTVKEMLESALTQLSEQQNAKVVLKKFAVLKGFPTLAEIFNNPDGSGSNVFLAFTKRGSVLAFAKSPKTQEGLQNASQFLDSVDLADRK